MKTPDAMALLLRIDARLERIERAHAAAFANDDAWTRLPRSPGRCPVSGWSRSTILNYAREGRVRSKLVRGARFYAAADVAAILSQPQTATPQ